MTDFDSFNAFRRRTSAGPPGAPRSAYGPRSTDASPIARRPLSRPPSVRAHYAVLVGTLTLGSTAMAFYDLYLFAAGLR